MVSWRCVKTYRAKFVVPTCWFTMSVLTSSMVELTDGSHVKLDVMPPAPSPPPPQIISDVDADPVSAACDDEPNSVHDRMTGVAKVLAGGGGLCQLVPLPYEYTT